ncbi:MAG TPA: hypothetical protein VHC22_19690 [Pirellulales bacterium]|nr:hypothetical protein [Pirellulales bacterium]
MIRRVVQWLRVAALPPRVWLLLLPVLAIEVCYWCTVWQGAAFPIDHFLLQRRDWLLIAAAILLGMSRVQAFHPLYQHGYRNWLRVTPWTSGVPLPVGPIHLVLQDAVLLLLGFLLWHHPQVSQFYLPLGFMFGYLALLCASFASTGMTGFAYLLAFGLGEVIRQWYDPATALAIAVWLYLAGWIGLRRMLAKFPWGLSTYWTAPSLQSINEANLRQMLGWPLDQLQRSLGKLSYVHGCLLSLLMGWWAYSLISLVPNPMDAANFMRLALGFSTIPALAMRTFPYWMDYRPPISFWGRLLTLRWIIPRYDHFLIAPILISIAATTLPYLLVGWQVPDLAALALTVSVVLGLAANMPPSLENWRLTGFHRIVPGSMNKQEFEKI